jgi:hypothetical protein
MAKFKFVGFQEHVEIPEGFELLEVQETLQSSHNRDSLFLLVGTPAGLSKWFYTVHQLDSRPGGKVSFEDHSGKTFEGRCTAVTMGREISLLADPFGQINIRISAVESGTQVDVAFAILTNQRAEMSALYQLFINSLKAQI